MEYGGIITIKDGKRSGKPCIRRMRIIVPDVLKYLDGGMSEDEILVDLSEFTRDNNRACLAFAEDRDRRLLESPSPTHAVESEPACHSSSCPPAQ